MLNSGRMSAVQFDKLLTNITDKTFKSLEENIDSIDSADKLESFVIDIVNKGIREEGIELNPDQLMKMSLAVAGKIHDKLDDLLEGGRERDVWEP